jgi:O-methyltransferase
MKKVVIDAVARVIFCGRRLAGERFLDSRRDSIIIPAATYSPWLLDGEFMGAYRAMRRFTKLDIYRAYSLWSLARRKDGGGGVIVEVGCWRGGASCIMAKAAPKSRVWAYDTFTGCVMAGPRDNVYAGGEHADATSLFVALAMFKSGVKNVTTTTGTFPESKRHTGAVKLAHIDVDTHDSALQSFMAIAPDVPSGGVVVFDDYGFSQTRGVQIAVDYVTQGGGWIIIHNLNGQAILVRTGARA